MTGIGIDQLCEVYARKDGINLAEHYERDHVQPTDVAVEDHGTVLRFTLKTTRAREWVNEHVSIEGWQWTSDHSFVADHRPGHALVDIFIGNGFSVEAA